MSSTHQNGFWQRSLEHYPANSTRIWYLALSVIATIVLYYQSYVLPSVAPLVLTNFHLTLQQYSYSLLLANLLGAFASIFGGFSDRLGRANLVIYGLLVSSVITFAISFTSSATSFLVLYWLLGFIEGIILVATPALVRDFSPRLGRAMAMGFWTVGPVGGSVLATTVLSQTIHLYGSWQSQYVIAAITGLVAFVICLFALRELSPALRAQIMTTLRERELLEARARGIDTHEIARHPWRQMARPKVIVSSLGISFFLLLYFAAVGFFPTYLNAIFGYSLADANGLMSIFWLVNVPAAVIVGLISDRMGVRKPFMLLGTAATIVVTLIFIAQIGQHPSSALMATLLGFFGLTIATAYVTWMAGFTETVEDINPALVATGLAVWGFVLRWVVVLSTVGLTVVVGSFASASGWATWWWVCIGGMVLFVPTVFMTAGYWRPSLAHAAQLERERAEGLSIEPTVG